MDNGAIITLESQMEEAFRSYFKELFTSGADLDMHEALDAVETIVTPEMNSMLRTPFTKEEISIALSQMHPSKAPGPDGMSALFFKNSWHFSQSVVYSCLL
ncbi:hypothetical protein C2S52_015349 [Perilla frutescens var. hirtella]|nr:hypothetical protein C2S52_015349 [Perilla frutescens var. hirtella]